MSLVMVSLIKIITLYIYNNTKQILPTIIQWTNLNYHQYLILKNTIHWYKSINKMRKISSIVINRIGQFTTIKMIRKVVNFFFYIILGRVLFLLLSNTNWIQIKPLSFPQLRGISVENYYLLNEICFKINYKWSNK